jgi:isoleucyl-tRNA synthetase
VTERVWQALFAEQAHVESVHLAAWPRIDPDSGVIDARLAEQVQMVRRIVELGRAARAESKVKTRQPLARALVSATGWGDLGEELRQHVRDELNVVDLESLRDAGEVIDVTVKPNFKVLGKKFGPRMKEIAARIAAARPGGIAESLHQRGSVVLGGITFTAEELIVNQSPASGWAVTSDGAETVALDLELTAHLRRAGLLREIVRIIQEARKNAGLDVSDRIEVFWQVGGSPEPAAAIEEHADELRAEVLATSLTHGAPADPAGWATGNDEELGLTYWLRRA